MPRTASVHVTCDQCASPLVRPASHAARTTTHFCNRTCQGNYRSAHLTGDHAPNWKGGTKHDGLRTLIHCPDHPYANGQGYVYRYRIVMEHQLGRYLLPGEIVHHIDDDETNDNPDNLEVLSQADHSRYRDANRKKGRWAQHYDQCIDCGTASRKHDGHGRCTHCGQRWRHTAIQPN